MWTIMLGVGPLGHWPLLNFNWSPEVSLSCHSNALCSREGWWVQFHAQTLEALMRQIGKSSMSQA